MKEPASTIDTRKRSWMKSITWRVVGVVILGAITYAFTRDVTQTTGITIFFHSVRFALYYWHERIWERILWGRIHQPLAGYQMRSDLTSEDYETIKKFLKAQDYMSRQHEYQI